MQIFFVFFLLCFVGVPLVKAQGVLPVNQQGNNANIGSARDINVSLEGEKPPITDYKIIGHDGSTTHVDTTLTIQKDYKYNYLRKDDYHLMPFANVGQTYNTLVYDFNNYRLRPRLGARARHFNYMEIEDITYYHVPTPLTELYYKTAFEQGQQLDAFLTVNTTEQFNFSLAYKGVRSLGNYRNTLTSTGNFRFTSNYHTKNHRYNIQAHIVFQDLMNQENGGLQPRFIEYFKNDDDEFHDRARLEVNLQDTENILKGKRFYLEHSYTPIQIEDSLTYTRFKIGNVFWFEDKYYQFDQKTPSPILGEAYTSSRVKDRVSLEDLYVQLYAQMNNNLLGNMRFAVGYSYTNYGYNQILILQNQTIQNRIVGSTIDFSAEYAKEYRGFELSGKAGFNISGEWDGSYIIGTASYQLNEENKAKATLMLNSVKPEYNFLLYQSDYQNYNWQNNHFKNVFYQHVQFDVESTKLLNASVSYTGIENYSYFAHNADSLTKPYQYSGKINYLKIEAHKELHYKKFSWSNTATYQNVLSGEKVFNTPQILARSSIYYSDYFFKKALYLQTGVTGKYFTEYYMNGYDPVIAEFYVQNQEKYGNFPMLDFFINAKISQTRIYLKWEHFNTLFTDPVYFSAPGHPYRDWKIRFGLVWNFFM